MKQTTVLLVALLAAFVASAQTPGSPDLNFGANGSVKIDFEDDVDFGLAIVPYGNDFLVGGIADSGSTRQPAFARLRPDGSFNNLFGGNGHKRINVGIESVTVSEMLVQPDNKIVAIGSRNDPDESFVMRMFGTGGLDNSFSDDGILTSTMPGNSYEVLYGVALQPDGKIVVTGFSGIGNDWQVLVMRLNTDGSFDNSFSFDGKVLIDAGGYSEKGSAVTIQPDGKIVVSGSSDGNMLLMRLNANGSLDNSFSLDGKAMVDRGYSEYCYDVAIQTDGKILLVGESNNRPEPSCVVVRYNTDGTLDNTFGTAGIVDTSINGNTQGSCLVLQSDGKILLGGNSYDGQNKHQLLLRLNMNGSFDNTFANGGIYISSFEQDGEQLYGMTLLPSGKLATIGFTNYVTYDFFTALYIIDDNVGVLDFATVQSAMLVYPNPVRTSFQLSYELAQAESLNISLHDINGRTIAVFAQNESNEAGKHSRSFQLPTDICSGHYLLRIANDEGTQTLHLSIQQ